MKKLEHIDKYKYPQYFTETERISNLSSLQLIEVTPGWYIESIPSSKWWFLQDNPEMGEQLIAKAGRTIHLMRKILLIYTKMWMAYSSPSSQQNW